MPNDCGSTCASMRRYTGGMSICNQTMSLFAMWHKLSLLGARYLRLSTFLFHAPSVSYRSRRLNRNGQTIIARTVEEIRKVILPDDQRAVVV